MKQVQGLFRCYELVFDNDEPEIPGSIVIRGSREKNLMWQKEALINIGLRDCSPEVKYFGWIDHDAVFQNADWINDAITKLKINDSVQLFRNVQLLDKNQRVAKTSHRAPGLAWMANRKYMDLRNGLYPYAVVGGGDTLFPMKNTGHLPPSIAADYKYPKNKWMALSQGAYHLWHGDMKNRQRHTRQAILIRNNYTPNDVRLNDDGILEWATDKPGLRGEVREFFASRQG